jgi:hypothetical protein
MSNPFDFSSPPVVVQSKGNLGGTQSILTLTLFLDFLASPELLALNTTDKTRPPFLIYVSNELVGNIIVLYRALPAKEQMLSNQGGLNVGLKLECGSDLTLPGHYLTLNASTYICECRRRS